MPRRSRHPHRGRCRGGPSRQRSSRTPKPSRPTDHGLRLQPNAMGPRTSSTQFSLRGGAQPRFPFIGRDGAFIRRGDTTKEHDCPKFVRGRLVGTHQESNPATITTRATRVHRRPSVRWAKSTGGAATVVAIDRQRITHCHLRLAYTWHESGSMPSRTTTPRH